MAESFVQVNKTVDPDPDHKLKTFTSVDGSTNTVHAEAVVLVDSDGHEIHPLTDAQLRASPIPVSVSASLEGPVDQGDPNIDGKSWPVHQVGAPPLPSGAATSANQTTEITALSVVAGATASIDAKTVHVDTGAVVVANSALPAGAATSAKQDTGNTSIASVDTKTPALVGGRVPVDGSGVTQPVSAAALPLPAGAATEATLATRTKPSDQQHAIVDSSALPTGASTEATLALAKADLDTIATNTTIAAPGGLQNGAQVAVGAAAVVILAANASRRGAVIQNVGSANIRIGKTGVTAATGLQLRVGGTMTLEPPFIPVGDIYAIREGAVDSTAYAAEVT